MKYVLTIIGLMMIPAHTLAAEPLSPWVEEVLARADAGISMASGLPGGGCPSNDEDKTYSLEKMVAQANEVIRPYIDVQKQISLQSKMLRERTACLQSDINLLEAKANQIQKEVTAAIAACNSNRAAALLETYKFTADASITLLEAGSDPGFDDDRLRYNYAFNDAGLWNAAQTGGGPIRVAMDEDDADDLPLCPYTTDYSPRSVGYLVNPDGTVTSDVKSFGCDLSVLATLDDPEVPWLDSFLQSTDSYANTVADLITQFSSTLDQAIRTLRGLPPSTGTGGGSSTLQHGVQMDCQKPAYLEPYSIPYKDILLNAFPDYFTDSDEPDTPMLPIGMLLMPSFDYFSVNSNPMMLNETYIQRRNRQGAERPDPAGASFADDDYFTYLGDNNRKLELQRRAADIERSAGTVDAAGRDSLERMQNAFSPLTVAVSALSESVHGGTPQGVTSPLPFIEPVGVVPQYISNLTYFLSRQCVEGHCQRTLDSVAKRIHNPYCTPYISGIYADDKTYAKCFCIPKDGANPNGLEIGGADKVFYEDYCLGMIKSEDQQRYDSLEPMLYPACQVDGTNI